eukprot:SAG11_NODE_26210_length_348_cov_0.883534_1_plen_49_part_10
MVLILHREAAVRPQARWSHHRTIDDDRDKFFDSRIVQPDFIQATTIVLF